MAKSSIAKRGKGSKRSSPKPTNNLVGSVATNGEKPKTESRKYNFIIRTIWTFVMISGFFITLASGHIWCVALVLLCQITAFKECIALTSISSREKNLPLTKTLNWYFLFTTLYYLSGKHLFTFFQTAVFENKILTWMALNHKFVCYCLYVLGFVLFVCSLRKGFLKFQFASLCATHMALLFIVFQGNLITKNILNGLFWFLVPCGLVIVNDIFAYLCGITFGKTKLIEISPKKTLEGFMGAWFFTAISSVIFTRLLSPYMYMTCPVQDIHANFLSNVTCELNPIFLPQIYRAPPIIFEKFGISSITIKPVYFHALNLATFASLFAPFGGFFASGIKRTFKVKDFGHSIPGHGGITDRIDCQFLMGSFANLYYETFISEHRITVETVLSTILMNLDDKDILELITTLIDVLFKKGVLSKKQHKKVVQVFAEVIKALN
ncbi:similar to Saccharomyces cerevisiae YBR029C CDS1 Phosphatidate cytidylyltransferase (CDP- diglyceride synthetase) [Maudiozyma barnettii]|uniref:Phosphatidate cytidylyltransferase n=1 Tax=Maudiozyma barnettii TaxID=61262 RepID=A0A8H2ZG91_9SACH|nr:phosphatidate cytidylyltransferase [Kazachstania barnettii]CAB4253150.1 similar to Saccharomyces cerevisiae YBR029C CDS1 Phosphatidate cytidylyltransferase (CDP- diglyceride synthetase) [Kazachstania barnettii]CAD1780314.1 similar to Saccharomyces cerevisiae YBR029C CDS1 Phosphatidate cytidylyltransferase (CDP- diglyceride synthetase) [Kazachstania barnettii]